MGLNIHFEAHLMVMSLLTGVWLMMSYDILRTLRILIPHGPIWMGVEDFFYWIYSSIMTFSLLYRQNDGGLRVYAIAGIFIGMIVYNSLISRFFLKLLKNLTGWIKMNLHKIVHARKVKK